MKDQDSDFIRSVKDCLTKVIPVCLPESERKILESVLVCLDIHDKNPNTVLWPEITLCFLIQAFGQRLFGEAIGPDLIQRADSRLKSIPETVGVEPFLKFMELRNMIYANLKQKQACFN